MRYGGWFCGSLCTIALGALAVSASTAMARSCRVRSPGAGALGASPRRAGASAVQQRLTRLFAARDHRAAAAPPPVCFSDMITLARQWDRLSDSFRARYLDEIAFPAGYDHSVSPSGLFEMYYTLEGVDRIPAHDTLHVDSGGIIRRGSNATPDYVDYVGCALDSVWRTEVVELGFPAPITFRTEQMPSTRYKILISDPGAQFYGLTYIAGAAMSAEEGFASFITIRNDWSGWSNGGDIDYGRDPRAAIRITCAHELFHAIQLAMVTHARPGGLDNFPLSWLEGTAVLMEEIAFDYVNDWAPHAASHFANPERGVFSREAAGLSRHSLCAIFLYEQPAEGPDISFIRTVYEYGAADRSLAFDRNLAQCAKVSGQSWGDLLGRFHAESYFTGPRARPGAFIADAALLPAWSGGKQFGAAQPIVDTVVPHGMARCVASLNESIGFTYQVEITLRETSQFPWRASAIVQSQHTDRLIPIPLLDSMHGRLAVSRTAHDTALIIVVSNSSWSDNLVYTATLAPAAGAPGGDTPPCSGDIARNSSCRYDPLGRRQPAAPRHPRQGPLVQIDATGAAVRLYR